MRIVFTRLLYGLWHKKILKLRVSLIYIRPKSCIDVDPRVEELVRDAEDLLRKAVEEMNVNVRDAAEKAWGATLRASNALILARTGKVPERTPETTRMLHELCSREPEIERVKLCDRYHTRSDYLYGYCFYEGRCEPVKEVKRRILETKELIEDVKKLIGA